MSGLSKWNEVAQRVSDRLAGLSALKGNEKINDESFHFQQEKHVPLRGV